MQIKLREKDSVDQMDKDAGQGRGVEKDGG